MDEKPATSPRGTELSLDTGERPIDLLELVSVLWNSRKLNHGRCVRHGGRLGTLQ